MTRYADPQRCPDCLGGIVYGAPACPICELPLSGPVAARLFSTLAEADELLRTLRDSRPSGVPVEAEGAGAGTPAVPAAAPGSRSARPARARTGLSAASVPRILLGLGAVCLLVAALVFLAVTWSVMGVAGRTATLVGFTVVAGGLAAWLARRDLRAAAESLTVVALGLLAFDLVGARDSGWFGDITTPGFLAVLGAALTVAGAAAALAVRRTPAGVLTGAQVVAVLGIATTCAGWSSGDRFAVSAALTGSVLLAAAAAFAAHRLRLVALAVGASAVTGGMWLLLLSTSLERAGRHPTAAELWLDLEAWPLLAAALTVGALAVVRPLPTSVRVAGLAAAELVVAVAVLVPFTQGTGTELTLAVLGVLAVGSALTWLGRAPWSRASAVTVGAGALWMVVVGLVLAAAGAARLLDAGELLWAGDPGGRLPAASGGTLAAWLLPVAVAALVGAGVVLARAHPGLGVVVAPLADPALGVALAAAAAVGTLAAYPVPVWLVVVALLLPAAAFTARALAGGTGGARAGLPLGVGAGFLAGALVVSLYDEWLTAASLLVTLVGSAVVQRRYRRDEVRLAAGALAAASLAASLWTWGALAGAERTWTAAAVLVVLAVVALVAPFVSGDPEPDPAATAGPAGPGAGRVGTEVGAAASMLVAGMAGVAAAADPQVATWTAVYLTIAGVAASTMSLLRADRRWVGWAGGALLATASWVRLWDLGVEQPEAYTVPSAVALGLVGLVHLRRHPSADTMTALGPALGLGLVPSLLWVLWEPVTLRSALLGAACLVLVLAGARLRWTAPVVLGATVGALVVLRHAAPFVDQAVPRWVLIAAAGTILIGMGITWERRIREARAVLGYVRALR